MYDINLKVIKKGRGFYGIFFAVGLFFGAIMFMGLLEEGFTEISDLLVTIPFFILPISFMGIGVSNFMRINKRIRIVKNLNKTGKLVKGLPYRMERTGEKSNGRRILKPVIDYQLPDGTIVKLEGDNRYDFRTGDYDGLADLVIDESDPTKYFIDFEINRLGGNDSSDFSKIPTQEKDPYSSNYGTFK